MAHLLQETPGERVSPCEAQQGLAQPYRAQRAALGSCPGLATQTRQEQSYIARPPYLCTAANGACNDKSLKRVPRAITQSYRAVLDTGESSKQQHCTPTLLMSICTCIYIPDISLYIYIYTHTNTSVHTYIYIYINTSTQTTVRLHIKLIGDGQGTNYDVKRQTRQNNTQTTILGRSLQEGA